jgi:hypothetical protein
MITLPPPPPALPYETAFRCCDCGSDVFAASVVDPRRCVRCARQRYTGWRRTSSGWIRRVPPVEAARWRE